MTHKLVFSPCPDVNEVGVRHRVEHVICFDT
jgi:hypothetical protein